MKTLIGLVVLFLALAPLAHANGGGSDGCGLGWEITQKKSFLATSTRATTNAFIPPTFGMTTGTLGCDKHSIAKRDEAGVNFVASNQDNLLMEISMGQGEHLDALARELGCGNSSSFGPAMQKSLPVLINTRTSVELYKGIRQEARALGCSA
jgi:hypothetical protein